MKYFRSLMGIAAVAICAASAQAEPLPEQMVTYGDFGYIHCVAASIDHVYFATTEGIIRYNKSQRRWEEPLTGSIGIDHRDIRRVWVDAFDQKIFAQTGGGYFELDLLFDKWYPLSELPELNNDSRHVPAPAVMYPPVSLNYSADGYLIDGLGRRFAFSDVVDDKAGNLWIGTWGYGPLKAGAVSGIIDLLPCGLLQRSVNTIYRKGALLWVSGAVLDSYRTGISVLDTRQNTFSFIESGAGNDFPAVDVNCLTGNDRFVYIGTNAGVFIYDQQSQKMIRSLSEPSGLPNDNILALNIMGDSLLVGTESGLCLVTLRGDSARYVRPDQFANRMIYDFQVADSAVWIATEGGAYRLTLPSGQLQKFQDPTQILFGRVYNIELSESNLWFAADAGLLKLDLKTGQTLPFSSIVEGQGPRALAVNDRIAAVASDRGVTILFHSLDHPSSREFTTDDGLPSSDVYSLLLDGDYLWIGSSRGLTRFWWNNPNRID